MLVLDLYCCAGGAATGYSRAGYDVVGVDIDPQPHYPFDFTQADARTVLRDLLHRGWFWVPARGAIRVEDIDLIHASPPCQLFTMYNNVKKIKKSTTEKYLNLIPSTRELLRYLQTPYVMENVPGARGHLHHPFQLCGTSFNIPVRRHRLFETGGWTVTSLPLCEHKRFTERIFPGSSNRPNGRTVANIGEYRVPLVTQKECMTVDWKVTLRELSEMVPPPMTTWIGEQYEAFKRASGADQGEEDTGRVAPSSQGEYAREVRGR